MRANGATPRVYRSIFGKDIFLGMQSAIGADMQVNDSEVFENVAFCMATQAGSIPAGMTIDQWLEAFSSPLAILNAAPAIMELWTEETKTISTEKKE